MPIFSEVARQHSQCPKCGEYTYNGEWCYNCGYARPLKPKRNEKKGNPYKK